MRNSARPFWAMYLIARRALCFTSGLFLSSRPSSSWRMFSHSLSEILVMSAANTHARTPANQDKTCKGFFL